MHTKVLLVFAATYLFVMIFSYTIAMSSTKNDCLKNLSPDSKTHYDKVKHDRSIKGSLAMGLGLLFGILTYILVKDKKNAIKQWSIIFIVTFGSMFLLYDIMWQDQFLFEERNLDKMLSNGLDKNDENDLKCYAEVYRNKRFISNIIKMVSVMVALICAIIYAELKKQNKV